MDRVVIRGDVIVVNSPTGSLSLELAPIADGRARAFLKQSPRNVRLDREHALLLGRHLADKGYSRILVQDNAKGTLRYAMPMAGWSVGRAIDTRLHSSCSVVTTYDLPLDESLIDERGCKPDTRDTSGMMGISIGTDDRRAWAFYTDEGDTARIVSEGERRQGMLVACSIDEMFLAADCLISFLALAGKKWAVFSTDLGRFIRKYDPATTWRMSLDRPTAFQHSVQPLSKETRRMAVSLFSEYYDESRFQAMLRLRSLARNPAYSIHVLDGGFVIVRLDGDAGLIYDIYVSPARQGEGLGGELMRCALTSLAGKASTVYLHTSYPRAKSLYEKFGFKTVYSQLVIRLDELVLTPPPS